MNAIGAMLVSRIRVRFLTPTELKADGGIAPSPLFHILAARTRDRVSNLRQFYQDGRLAIDFRRVRPPRPRDSAGTQFLTPRSGKAP